MTKSQIAKQESYKRIDDSITNNATLVIPVVGLTDEVTDLNATVVKIVKASTAQIATPIGVSASEASKLKMANTVMKLKLRAKVKAKRLGLTSLVHQLNQPISDYLKATKIDAISMAKSARNILNDNKATLVIITAADITELDGTIDDYTNIKDEPVEAKIVTKAAGTDLLPPLFKAADASVVNILDLIESYIGTSQPAFTNEIKIDAELRISGARHTSADFDILADEDGTPLLKAEVEDTSSAKIYKPGSDHQTIIPTHNPGYFSFNISCPGYQKVAFGAQLNRAVINHFTIRLKKNL